MSLKPKQNVPSWDEFRVVDDVLDYEENEPFFEPNNSNEYGPSLPPTFRNENTLSDFIIFGNDYDEEPNDPEDPTQLHSFKSDFGLHAPNLSASSSKFDESSSLPSISQNSLTGIQQPCSSNQIIGPHLPSEFSFSNFLQSKSILFMPEEPQEQNDNGQRVNGPSLPNELLPTVSTTIRNDNYDTRSVCETNKLPFVIEENFNDNKTNNSIFDPVLENNSDDDIIGPAMPPKNQTQEEVKDEFFNRLLLLETKKSEAKSKNLKREEWMVELPQRLKQSYGLSAKSQFARNSGPELTGSDLWTQTLNGNSKPSTSKKTYIKSLNSSKTKPIEQRESLVEIHQRKRKSNNNNNNLFDETNARRPFNRDLDMEVRNFGNSEGPKNNMGDISSRFQSGTLTKFL